MSVERGERPERSGGAVDEGAHVFNSRGKPNRERERELSLIHI